MQTSFAEGELIAGARITQWNVVRLIRVKNGYRLSRNLESLGTYERLDQALTAFEKASRGIGTTSP